MIPLILLSCDQKAPHRIVEQKNTATQLPAPIKDSAQTTTVEESGSFEGMVTGSTSALIRYTVGSNIQIGRLT